MEAKCRFCHQIKNVKKHGIGEGGHQRYCCRTFQLEYIYRACHAGIKKQFVNLAMNNAGIRNTSRTLHIGINAVVQTLKNFPHDV
ncbi:IS1-like element transposase [Photorhabdus tasmaniensis]|uniref:IS1-like element transposase n=1 Tax=Photorhabdus tasmaniensis TaxID=1004159 RepID=UPI0040432ED6